MITKHENYSTWLRVRHDVTHSEVIQQDNAFGEMCIMHPKDSPENMNVGLNSHFSQGFNQ